MVKVSFNSALAQKEAVKKEEENSQVLILPPDAKVRRAAGDRAAAAGRAARRRQALCCAPFGGEMLSGGGKGAEQDLILHVLLPPAAITRGRAGKGRLRSDAPRRPSRLTLLKWLTGERALKLRFSLLWGFLWRIGFCFPFFFSPTAFGPRPTRLLMPLSSPLRRPVCGPASGGNQRGRPGEGLPWLALPSLLPARSRSLSPAAPCSGEIGLAFGGVLVGQGSWFMWRRRIAFGLHTALKPLQPHG